MMDSFSRLGRRPQFKISKSFTYCIVKLKTTNILTRLTIPKGTTFQRHESKVRRYLSKKILP